MRELHPRLPRAVIGAMLLVVCMEVSMRFIPERFIVPYFSRLGFGEFMKHEVIPNFHNPQIVILGTSRAADAFMPTLMEDKLGLPPYSVLNMGVFGSRTSVWLEMYEQNRDRFRGHVKLVILNVDEWTFSSGEGSDEQFCLTAPFRDRIDFVQPVESPNPPNENPEEKILREREKHENLVRKRSRLFMDCVFQFRFKLAWAPNAILRIFGLGYDRAPDFDANHMIRSTSADVGKETVDPTNYDSRIHTFYKFFDTHPIYIRHVEELAAKVREDGGRFVLMHLPNKHDYQDEVEKLYPQGYAQHIRNTDALAGRLGVLFWMKRYPEEIGLKTTDYVDYCHMAYSGAIVATNWLVKKIQDEHVLEK